MKLNQNDRITSSALLMLVFSSIVGFGLIRLPFTVIKYAGHNGWLAIIAGGGISIIGTGMYIYLGQLFTGKTFIGYSREIMGSFLGGLLSWVLIINWIIFASYELWALVDFTGMYLLQRTPDVLIALFYLTIFIPFLRSGVEPAVRVAGVIFVFTVFVIVFFISFTYMGADFNRLQPIGHFMELKGFVKAIRETSLSFLGFEIIAIFFPFVTNKKGIFRKNVLLIVFITLIYIAVTVMVVAFLGVGTVTQMPWTVIEIVRAWSLPRTAFESLEIFFVVFWAQVSFTAYFVRIIACATALSEVVRARETQFWVVSILPVIYVLALLRPSVVAGVKWVSVAAEIAFGYIIMAPVLLLIVAKIRGKGKVRNG